MANITKSNSSSRPGSTASIDPSALDLEKVETAHLQDIEHEAHHTTSMEKAISSHPMEQVETHRKSGNLRWFLICLALYTSAFLYGLDNTIVADIQGAVVETFGAVEQLAWLGIGFPLGSIASILPIGKAFGVFDVKWLFIWSLVLFEIGSAVCGASPSMNSLIVGRVIAGAGGAGMYLGILNILSLNTTLSQRPFYISLCALCWGLGCVLGPVIGGSLADTGATGWRWAFYLNLFIFAVTAPVLFFLDSFNPQPDIKFVKKLEHLDWVGVVLNAGMYVAFVMPFTFAGAEWAWSDGRTIGLIVVFGVIFIFFAFQQTFALFTTVERRLFPVDFLRSRDLVLQYIATSTGSTVLFVVIYYIPVFFNFAKGDTNTETAVRLLPFIVLTIISTLFNGIFMPRWKYYMPWYFVGGFFATLGAALIYGFLSASTPNSQIYGFSVLLGLGAGLTVQAGYSVAQAKVPAHRIADAVGFINAGK
jgi:MFS family permease